MTALVEDTRTKGKSPGSLTRRLLARIGDLHADKSGAAAVVVAIVFPIMVGGLGLGAETGYWYVTQRKLQHAADVSAHAGGARLRAGDSNAQISAAALNVATNSGLLSSVGTIVVNTPPASGIKAGDSSSVEVILTEVHPRLFSAVFSSQAVTMQGRAVASVQPGSKACVLALSPTAAGAVTVSGSTSLTLQNCDVASNSVASTSFLMSGSASLSAACVYAVGQAVTTAQLTLTQCTAVKQYAPIVRDPYASVVEPTATGACHNQHVGSPNNPTTLTPTDNQPSGVKSMRFCNGLDLKGAVTFNPGLYIVEGGNMTANGGDPNGAFSNLSGSGVTFYFVNGGYLQLTSKAITALSAPTSGPYSGLLFFGSRTSAGASQTITGSSTSTLQGAIYMPQSDIQFTGNSATTNGCSQVIGLTVTFSGNSSLGSSCASAGTSTIVTNQTVTISE
jgi:Flp pilus assembly protein TadG